MTPAEIAQVVEASGMPPAPAKIMLALCRIASLDGLAAPDRRRLAMATGIAPSTIYQLLPVLCVRGWLRRTGRRHTPAGATEYQLLVPAAVATTGGWTSGMMTPPGQVITHAD